MQETEKANKYCFSGEKTVSYLKKIYKEEKCFDKILLKDIAFLLIKSTLIYLFIYLGDYFYSLYNSNYIHPQLSKVNIELFFIIFSILLFKNFYIRVLLLTFVFFTMLIEYFYFQYFGTYVQPIGFYQFIFNTKETFAVLSDEFSTMLIPLSIFIGLIISILVLKKYLKIKSLRNNKLAILILILVSAYSLGMTYKSLHSKSGKLWHKDAKRIMPMPKVYSCANYARAFRYFLVGIAPKKIFSNEIKMFPTLPKPTSKKNIENNNIIFIIGESLRAKELHLLGYKLQTTPKLEKIDNLLSKTIYSAGTMTKVSVSSLLNRVKYPGSTAQMMRLDNNLFKLAKEHGYKTYFYSWQNNEQLTILQNFMGRKYIDDYASREMIKQRLKKYSHYDDNLLTMLKKIDINRGKHFIVLHERGSHATYRKQYPKSYNKFKKTYDNTVLFTDSILSSIINYLKENSKKPTYIIYTSDHGELLYEHGRNGHGWFFSEVYKVPLLIYCINSDCSKIPFNNMQTHFDVSNLVTNLLGYNTKIEKEKTIYVNGSDVDALAGYLHIKLDNNGIELSIKKIR